MKRTVTGEEAVTAELRIFEKLYPLGTYDWEMTTKSVYLTSTHDNGYTTKANAKRAAKKVAQQLGITITSTEDET